MRCRSSPAISGADRRGRLLLVVSQEQIRILAGCDEPARNHLVNDRSAQLPVATLQLFSEEFGIVGGPGRELARVAAVMHGARVDFPSIVALQQHRPRFKVKGQRRIDASITLQRGAEHSNF